MPKKNIDDDLVAPPGVGHNSVPSKELMQIIEHVEALLEQKATIGEEVRESMEVAKSKGFEPRTIREMIKLRALDIEKRKEREELRDLYMVACGLA